MKLQRIDSLSHRVLKFGWDQIKRLYFRSDVKRKIFNKIIDRIVGPGEEYSRIRIRYNQITGKESRWAVKKS